MNWLLASAFVLKPLYPMDTPLEERRKILAPYFNPSYTETLTIAERNIIINAEKSLKIKTEQNSVEPIKIKFNVPSPTSNSDEFSSSSQ